MSQAQDNAAYFRPVAPPVVFEGAYTADQHARMERVVHDHGPWTPILGQHFKSPEEVLATVSGDVPEGVTLTWDMFLGPIFRGYFAKGGVCLYPEIEDCFLNLGFLERVRGYWGARYAQADNMLFNLQGPSGGGGAPHVDAAQFRGLTMSNTPIWLMNMMAKSGLFRRWKAKKAQIITWYYRGAIGGGFTYWPEGPRAQPVQLKAPMWGRAVVVENEMMFHGAESCGPSSMRRPAGLQIDSVIEPNPVEAGSWQIRTGETVIQTIPAREMRLLVHWGANLFMDAEELRVSLDHSDDLTHDQVFGILIHDMRARGEVFAEPTDPLRDRDFICRLIRVYDLGLPSIFPPEPAEDTQQAA